MTHTSRGRLPDPPGDLTDAQRRAVIETARGGTRAQVAARLYISVDTLRSSRTRAMRRLGATSTAHMVARAIGLGLIPADVALTPDDPGRTT